MTYNFILFNPNNLNFLYSVLLKSSVWNYSEIFLTQPTVSIIRNPRKFPEMFPHSEVIQSMPHGRTMYDVHARYRTAILEHIGKALHKFFGHL